MNRRLTFFMILVLALPICVNASPLINSLSGSVSDGGLVTISGGSFGTKSTARPIVFDNFDSGTNGNNVEGNDASHYGTWDTCSSISDTKFKYSNASNRNGSSLNAVDTYDLGDDGTMSIQFHSSNATYMLVSFWLSFTDNNPSGPNEQMKYWGISDETCARWDDDAYIQMNWWQNGQWPKYWFGGSYEWPEWSIIEGYSDNSYDFETHHPGKFKTDGTWQHHLTMIKQGDSGVANGIVKLWTDEYYHEEPAMITYDSGDGYIARYGIFGWWHGNTEAGNTVTLRFDDIYLDDTWQSVWIGDDATWVNCTHREIQIPTAWSDNSITITVNRGSFDSCKTYYLFVVDADGNVNTDGYPVRIVTGAGEAPCPPTGVELK